MVFHFLHIGKTGGTAFKEAARAFPPSVDYRPHPHLVRLADIPVGQKVFFFLRSPIPRFVSGFYSRQRRGQPRYNSPWSKGEDHAFACYKSPNALASDLFASDSIRRERAEFAMRTIEHVKSSYYDWFQDDAYFESRLDDIAYIGFTESMGADFAAIKTLLGMPADAALPTDDIGAHRNAPDLDRSLDDAAVDNLQRWYQRDQHFYDLCRGIRDRLNPLPDMVSAGRSATGRTDRSSG